MVEQDNKILSKTAFYLFVFGLVSPAVLIALGSVLSTSLIAGTICEVLALILGACSWQERLSKIVVKSVSIILVISCATVFTVYQIELNTAKQEVERRRNEAIEGMNKAKEEKEVLFDNASD